MRALRQYNREELGARHRLGRSRMCNCGTMLARTQWVVGSEAPPPGRHFHVGALVATGVGTPWAPLCFCRYYFWVGFYVLKVEEP